MGEIYHYANKLLSTICFNLHAIFLNTHKHTNIIVWGRRILRLHLCRGVRSPHNECLGYDIKQSDGETPVMLELWGMRSTLSLASLLGPLWPNTHTTHIDRYKEIRIDFEGVYFSVHVHVCKCVRVCVCVCVCVFACGCVLISNYFLLSPFFIVLSCWQSKYVNVRSGTKLFEDNTKNIH